MTSSREYSSLESPAKGTYLALNREFFSRGAETRGGREGRCQGATGCFGIDREQVFGEQGFVLNETCPIGDRARECRGCTHHGDRPARECYPPPRERRRSPCGAARGRQRRAHAGRSTWSSWRAGGATYAGGREGGGEGGHVVLSAVEGDTRWLDRRSGEERDSFRLQDSAMAGTDASASGRGGRGGRAIRENLFKEQIR